MASSCLGTIAYQPYQPYQPYPNIHTQIYTIYTADIHMHTYLILVLVDAYTTDGTFIVQHWEVSLLFTWEEGTTRLHKSTYPEASYL